MSFHRILLSGKLQQAVHWASNREGWGCLLLGDICTKTTQQVADALWENQPDIQVPPMENPMCAAFEVYEELLEMTTLYFS